MNSCLLKKAIEITANPHRYKNLTGNLKKYKRVHVGDSIFHCVLEWMKRIELLFSYGLVMMMATDIKE
ncbi:MAG: hypothetical protein PQ968_11375 [Methanobacterium sp.]